MKNIAICGDSFSIGIGCLDLDNEPFGAILGKHLNRPVINLAKGSSTNLSIFLQVKHVVEKMKNDVDLVIVSNTSYDRIDWFPLEYQSDTLNLEEVNYHQYPPYGKLTYQTVIDHPMKDNPAYKGKMFTENFHGVIDYWEKFGSKNKNIDYFARFNNEPPERMKLLYDFAKSVHDEKINRMHSIGCMTMAHQLLKNAGINHLILTHEVAEYNKFMDLENLMYLSWGELSILYPDTIPTKHTSPEGHRFAFLLILRKLIENKWA
jgi:hypothetical protein